MREWAYPEFGEFLDARMEAQGIHNDAELSRRSGVKQTQISNWRRGLARPAPESLDKIAGVLRVPSAFLYQLSGHLSEQAPTDVDLNVIPDEFRQLVELYNDERLTDEDRSYLRRHVGLLATGLSADVAGRRAQEPAKRSRRGRAA